MAHLKHSGTIRRASALKRTALIEIYSDVEAANDELAAIDREFEVHKAADCATFGQPGADRTQAAELARIPGGGYVEGLSS